MDTSALAQSAPEQFTQVAAPKHTIAVIGALAASAISFKLCADRITAAPHPNRLRFYLVTITVEWLIFTIVVIGVWHNEAALARVLGARWYSIRQALRDSGIAVGFWVIAVILLSIFRLLLGIRATPDVLRAISPHGRTEIMLWIVVSVTAGICEETIFRGYLQAQFLALTRNAPAGILLSAIIFGACHAYQGFRFVILIALYGAMFGWLAYWSRTVRPGMIAHAWHDVLSGIVVGLMQR